MRHRAIQFLAALLALLLGTCLAKAPPVPHSGLRAEMRQVAVLYGDRAPQSNFVTFAKSKGAGALKGALIHGGTIGAVSAVVVAGASGIAVPILAIFGSVVTAADTLLGIYYGAEAGIPAGQAHSIEQTIDSAVGGEELQAAFANQVAGFMASETNVQSVVLADPYSRANHKTVRRPVPQPVPQQGIDGTLAVAIEEIGFESCGPEFVRRMAAACPEEEGVRKVALFMRARMSLYGSDGSLQFERSLRYASARREIGRWRADGGQLLHEELRAGWQELAERIVEEAFLIAPLPLPNPSSLAGLPGPDYPDYGLCWLPPLSPAPVPVTASEIPTIAFSRPDDLCPAASLHFSSVDSRQPELRWSPFPRSIDRREFGPELLQRIDQVRYELRIWSVEGCERGRLLYSRRDLPAPAHRLEEPLPPGNRYFWSVRARFSFDGQTMLSRWSLFDPNHCLPENIADWQYHRFQTPP